MTAGKLALGLGAIALVVIVAVGVRQATERTPAPPKPARLTAAEISRRLSGAPPELAALHRQANRILPGARRGLERRLRRLRGHPVVVNVWAAWCGPCRAEMPVMQQVSVAMGREVAFLGVDLNDNRAAARRFLERTPVGYPSYDDPSGEVYNAQGLQGVPTTMFYDRRGHQTYVHQGPYYTRADLERDIRRYAIE